MTAGTGLPGMVMGAFLIVGWGFHIWFKQRDGIPHDFSGFYHLRQEHLAVCEKSADGFHTSHQWPLYDADC